ncbi:hypothetical protein SBBP2_70065 [Burkholderiales bacterium]|nr:hypothetical protein SBBP2_70065 [Burkholderiales bacterium]
MQKYQKCLADWSIFAFAAPCNRRALELAAKLLARQRIPTAVDHVVVYSLNPIAQCIKPHQHAFNVPVTGPPRTCSIASRSNSISVWM